MRDHTSSARELLFVGAVLLFLAALVIVLLGGSAWGVFAAIEDRFGANVAILVFGGLGYLFVFFFGVVVGQKSIERGAKVAHSSQTGFLDGLDTLGQVIRGTASVQREYARGEREAFNARVRADVVDEARVHRLAEQKAKAMIVEQRAADRPAPSTWSVGAEVPAAARSGGVRVLD